MSKENVEIVRRVYSAFNADGVEALMPLFAPDVVIHPFPEWVEQPAYRGHDGLRVIRYLDPEVESYPGHLPPGYCDGGVGDERRDDPGVRPVDSGHQRV